MDTFLRHGAPPLVIAHRGASSIAPENTMPAFIAAWDAGADWVETDVQPTADDVLVLLHDDDVDRTTDGTGPIRGFTGQAAEALDAGSWFSPSFAGTRIPQLSELLGALTGNRRLLLEIKGEHTLAQVRSVIQAIRTAQVEDRVFLESFDVASLQMIRQVLPDAPFALAVEVLDEDPVARCRALGATAYNPDVAVVLRRPELVGELHAAGIAVQPWASDSPDEWARLTSLGVDAIFTNTPGPLLKWQASA